MERTESYPGFRFKLVDDNLLCAICHRVPFNPVIGRCQHICCKSCIMERLRRLQSCPACQEKLTVNDLTNPGRLVTDIYRNLEISCEFNERGCAGWYRLGEIGNHQNECPKAPIKCRNEGCNTTVNRENLEEHERKKCEHRVVSCELCSMKVKQTGLKEHKDTTCLEGEYKCSCGQKMRRAEKDSHLASSCRDRMIVLCPVAGCGAKIAQGDIEAHIAGSIAVHLHYLNTLIQERENTYQQELARLRMNNDSLSKRVSEMRTTISNLQLANQQFSWYGMGEWILETDGRSIWSLGNMGQRLKEASLKKAGIAFAKGMEPNTPTGTSGMATPVNYVPFLFWSPLWFTHPNGYRFSLRLDFGNFPTVGLFLHMHESDHDEMLEWPFNLDYIVQIGNAKITTTQREAHSHYMKQGRPPHEMSWGWNNFCSIETLKEAIVQDTLTVSIYFYNGNSGVPPSNTAVLTAAPAVPVAPKQAYGNSPITPTPIGPYYTTAGAPLSGGMMYPSQTMPSQNQTYST